MIFVFFSIYQIQINIYSLDIECYCAIFYLYICYILYNYKCEYYC